MITYRRILTTVIIAIAVSSATAQIFLKDDALRVMPQYVLQ
jgi:hypothetical protein